MCALLQSLSMQALHELVVGLVLIRTDEIARARACIPSRPYRPRMMASRRLVLPYPFFAPIRTTFLFFVGIGKSNWPLA